MKVFMFRARFVAFCLGALFTFMGLETALRIRKKSLFTFEHQIFKIIKKRPNPCLSQIDPHLGWRTQSNKSSWVPAKREENSKSYVSSDVLGLRNNSKSKVTFNKPGFLALGDSFTFGDEVSDSETWPSQLEKISNIPIFNAGACGYGLDQAYIRYQELAPQIPLKGVIIEITPDGILRTERKGTLTSFFKQHISKPYFTISGEKLIEHSHHPLDPRTDYEKLDLTRTLLGYSFFFDFLFRKIALNWWWGIVKPNDYPASLKTEFKASEMSCKITQEWQDSLKSKGLNSYLVIQDYFKSRNFDSILERVKTCAEKQGFKIIDLRPQFEKIKSQDPSLFRLLWISKKGGHLSQEGNRKKALWIFSHPYFLN